MFFKVLWSFITGYVNIQIEGFYIERFVNLCISKNILLWGMDRKKSSILNANISINNFKRISKIAKKSKCKVKILSKKGLPFIFNKYKKRKIFAILLFIVSAFLVFSSNFIWNIEVRGTKTINISEIVQLAENSGLKIGALKSNIDTKTVINEIRKKRDDVAWIGIDFKGTNAIIKVEEADKKPKIVDKEDFCNIVANKEGIIEKINVQNGTAVVKIGDIVKMRRSTS